MHTVAYDGVNIATESSSRHHMRVTASQKDGNPFGWSVGDQAGRAAQAQRMTAKDLAEAIGLEVPFPDSDV